MARIALIAPSAAGHIIPISRLGGELLRRGHEVTLLTREGGQPLAQAAGIPVRVIENTVKTPFYPVLWAGAYCIGVDWSIGLLAGYVKWTKVLMDQVPGLLRELKSDMLISDGTLSASRTAAEVVGIPFITLNSALMWNVEPTVPCHTGGSSYSLSRGAIIRNRAENAWWELYMRRVMRSVNRYRARYKLPLHRCTDDAHSSLAQISQILQEFDFPRRELPAHSHYIGSLHAASTTDDSDFPWEKLDGRPLIYASLGTIKERMSGPVFRAIATACAGLNAQLLISLGKVSEKWGNTREQLGALDGNPLVLDTVPQIAILKRASVLITHAGGNTITEAIREAIPMIALPRSADHPALAARVEYHGLGLRDSFHRPNPTTLRPKVERVLTEPGFKQRCLQLQQAAVEAGGVVRAGDIIERVLATGKAVTREDMQRLAKEERAEAAAAAT